ncbi:unnamed protein product [Amaranthus hypochondriacus]
MRNTPLFGCFVFLLLSDISSAHKSTNQERDKIAWLPGQPENLNFTQYSGYVTVDNLAGRALFYWLTESPSNPDSKPLLLWLNGGPGCSSIAYGAAEEIGPLHILNDAKTLYINPYSWNNLANLLFLESPAGVGFSYSNTTSDLYNCSDSRTAKDSYKFLVRWFNRFPQYKYREFYIAGESYAGHYVPQLSQLIYRRNKGIKEPIINFKGLLVGNPVIDDQHDSFGTVEYWYSHGLISESTYNKLMDTCFDALDNSPSIMCIKAQEEAVAEFGNIDPYSIYTPPCNSTTSLKRRLRVHYPWMTRSYDPCTESYATEYFNHPDVQLAMHANSTKISYPWGTCNEVIGTHWSNRPPSMLPVYQELIAAGFRIWVFSGDADAIVPVTATQYSIEALKLPTVMNWYPWYHNGRIGGWSKVYKGLTLVTVAGAGHEVPLLHPQEALLVFHQFLKNQYMPTKSF